MARLQYTKIKFIAGEEIIPTTDYGTADHVIGRACALPGHEVKLAQGTVYVFLYARTYIWRLT